MLLWLLFYMAFHSLKKDIFSKSLCKKCIYLLVQMKFSWMVFVVVNHIVCTNKVCYNWDWIIKVMRLWGMVRWVLFLGLVMFLKLLFKIFKFQWQWFIGIGLGKMIVRSHNVSSCQILAQNLFSPFPNK
jgi:hypothetical protein